MNRPSSQPQPPSSRWDDEDDANSVLPTKTSKSLEISNQTLQRSEKLILSTGTVQFLRRTYPKNAKPNEKLTGEQIDWLVKRLSTEDQQEIRNHLDDCTGEMLLTRACPFTLLSTVGLYMLDFSKHASTLNKEFYLPKALQFGPRSLRTYAFFAFFSPILVGSWYKESKCGQRVKPKIFELYQKYTKIEPFQSTTAKESLKAANRQHSGQPYGISPSSQLGQQEPQPYDQQQRPINRYPTQPKTRYVYEDGPLISGTPFSPSTFGDEPREKPTRGGGSYGDKGFS